MRPRESPHAHAAASSQNGILLKRHATFRTNQGDSMSDRTVASSSASDQYALAAELISDDKATGLIGGYCEDGFPFYYANDAMAAMLGYDSVDDLIAGIKGMVGNTIHPADMVQVERDLGSEYYEGMTYETMYRMPRKNGTWFWTIDRGKVVRAEDGRLAIISMCSNLSDYVGRYTQMERHYEWSTLTLDNMPGGYHRCSPAEGYPFLHVSDEFLSILGWTREDIANRFDNKFLNMVHLDDRALLTEFVDELEAASSEKSDAAEGATGAGDLPVPRPRNAHDKLYRMQARDGYRWVIDASLAVEQAGGEFLQGIICDVTDFVEREHQRQRDLEQALEESRRATETVSRFFMNMSHEIRTPLNAIIGLNTLARAETDDPTMQRYLEKMRMASDQLLDVINDILDMSRIQNNAMTLDLAPLDVHDHIKQIDAMFSQVARAKGVDFRAVDNVSTPYVLGDRKHLSQVFSNLLGNAVKFTSEGGTVLFQADEESCEGGKISYCITVRDSGIGMSEEFQKTMFTSFARERNDTVLRTQGTGLGLAIVKNLTDLMGGTIECSSRQGEGTEFRLRFKLEKAEAPQTPESNRERSIAQLSGKRLLLVEDNELNREVSVAILEQFGCVADVAVDGLVALHTMEETPAGTYDAVLMDMQMPIMNGLEATRRIRALEDPVRANVPIVALTANAFEQDRRAALDAGMDGHVAKPIDASVLGNTLAAIWEARASRQL